MPKDNLCSERSVRFFDYELGIGGKTHFEKGSRMMTITKLFDLLQESGSNKFKKQAKEIRDTERP